jgi:two-component system, OmpR family, response regulator
MPKADRSLLLEGDILALTPKGQKELQSSGTSLSAAELEILVLLDGKSTLGETAARVRSRGKEQVFALCTKLLGEQWIQHATAASLDFLDFFQPRDPMIPTAAAMAKAKDELAATTRLLQQKGYTVRIARRAGPGRKIDGDRMLSVLVIEDEPHLGQVLKHILSGEGFDARLARDKNEIVAEMRRPPVPDLILLDVVLPDVDGFDILDRIRGHPWLKTVPVVMLTAQATRDAVLRGLLIGADGYITKPFEIDVLLKAVAAVLGLPDGRYEGTDIWQV